MLGFMYERYGTYEIDSYGGLAERMPWLATLFVITSLALIGLPLLNGFVGEFLILSGSFPGHVRLGIGRDCGRHSERGLHAMDGAAGFLRQRIRHGYRSKGGGYGLPRANRRLAYGRAHAGDGGSFPLLDARHR